MPGDGGEHGCESGAGSPEVPGQEDTLFVIPRYEGRRGHPVCVAKELAREFLGRAATDETRAVIQAHQDEILYVDVDDPGVLADIDDVLEYRRLVG